MMTAGSIRVWRFVHTWTSLICTAFLLMLCITGLPLIFSDEIEAAFSHQPPYPAAPASAHASLDRVAAQAQGAAPGRFIRYVFVDDDEPKAVVALAPNRDGPVRTPDLHPFDARTGAARPDDSDAPANKALQFLLQLHAFLLMGLVGKLFLGLMGALFVAALVSGTVLYAPFMRKLPFGAVRARGSRRLMWLDLHNLVGVVALAWMLVVGATGVMNALSAPLFGVWEMTDVAGILRPLEASPIVTPAVGPQEAADAALRAAPGMELASITYPAHFAGTPHHYVVWVRGDRTLTSRLLTPILVDARTGRVTRGLAMPWYLRALEVSRPLHFGDYGGELLKVLWGGLDLATIAVLGSGLYLWLAKRRSGARQLRAGREPGLAEELEGASA